MIEQLINEGVAKLFGIPLESMLAESLTFFVYDSIKIILLLFVMITIIGYLRSYISQKKLKEKLSKKCPISNIFASIFGAITPFCSCSSIPFFMGFVRAGVPLGVTFSFLITSPLVNEYVAVIMLATFGWKIALAYVIAGITIGIIAGLVIGKLKLEDNIEKEFKENKDEKEKIFKNQKERLIYGFNEAKKITLDLWIWILVGVGIGAILHGFVPEQFLNSFVSKGGIFAVPLAVIIGVPLYANCAAIVPVALVLFEKGIPLGTALAFMMATAALSLPEAIILRKVIKLKLIMIFFLIVSISIIVIGYLFNILQAMLI